MYTNLKPNKHKRISFNIMTMVSLGFIGPPLNLAPPKFNFSLRFPPPPNNFDLKVLGPPPLKLGWVAPMYFEQFSPIVGV